MFCARVPFVFSERICSGFCAWVGMQEFCDCRIGNTSVDHASDSLAATHGILNESRRCWEVEHPIVAGAIYVSARHLAVEFSSSPEVSPQRRGTVAVPCTNPRFSHSCRNVRLVRIQVKRAVWHEQEHLFAACLFRAITTGFGCRD